MPIRDELVQRTIEALAQALDRLFRHPDPQVVAAARTLLEDAYRVHLGTHGDVVRQLSSDQLVAVISSIGRIDAGRAYLAAALLEVDAAMPGLEPDQAAALRVRALDLYLEAGVTGNVETDLPERVRRLRASLLEHVLPEPTYGRLLRYWLHAGQYAVAEDLLFEWLEEHGPTVVLVASAERLYDDLEALTDEELIAGDLPRVEVFEGRATFRRSRASG
jgi:hypothetical protein